MRLLIILFTFLAGITLITATASDITGIWITEENNSKIEIYKCGKEYCGKICWMRDSLVDGRLIKDVNNKNPQMRERKVLGMQIIQGLKYNKEKNCFDGGKIYFHDTGREADLVIKVLPGHRLEVKAELGMFSKKLIWEKNLIKKN
jgi:uncharacterized protein (DUF2147 family)